MNAMSATAANAAAPHAGGPRGPAQQRRSLAIDCKVDKIYYGDFLAVRDSHVPIEKGKIVGFIGPSGCGKSTVLRSLNRMNDLIASVPVRGPRPVPGPGHLRQVGRPGFGPPPHRHGVPAAQPVLDEHLRERRLRPAPEPVQGRHGRAGRARPAPRRPVGRGQGQAQGQRPVALGRPAAAPVHRPRRRDRAHRAPDGRALLGARPDRHPADRGADAGAQEGIHDRDRDPQHAAGAAGGGRDHVLLGRHLRRAAAPAISSSRARPRRSSPTRRSSSPRTI